MYKYEDLVNNKTVFCSDLINQNKNYILWEEETILLNYIKSSLDEFYKTITTKHIFLNKETIALLIKLLRVFLFNKGHLVIIGGNLLGKQSISQFAAFLQKKTFVDYDDSLNDKSTQQVETLIKKNLADIYFKNSEAVLFFKDKLLKMVNK